MSEALIDTTAAPKLTPRERVATWEQALTENGWTVRITHTDQRARLEATHPSGAVVMVTSGIAGRTAKGNTKLYVLPPGARVWLCVRTPGFQAFAETRTVSGYRRRVESKCQCRTRAGRRKVRYATENRAEHAMREAQRQRAQEGQTEAVECRTYRCPHDDRAWHVSSRPSWRDAPGESALWNAPSLPDKTRRTA